MYPLADYVNCLIDRISQTGHNAVQIHLAINPVVISLFNFDLSGGKPVDSFPFRYIPQVGNVVAMLTLALMNVSHR